MKLRTKLIAALASGILIPSAGLAHGTPLAETVTTAANQAIPNLPGKRLVSLIVDYPPGAKSTPHHHAKSAFIYAYVLSGEVRSQVDDEPARTYRAGETWFESPGAHHKVSENASAVKPARLLAVFILDSEEAQLTFPNEQEATSTATQRAAARASKKD